MRPIYLHTSNLAQVITPACRGVLVLDPGLPELRDPESLASQVDDSWHASVLARQVSWAVTEVQPTSSPIFSISRKSVCS
jgi:hypothetical protein